MYTHVHTYTHARVASKCLSHTVDARRSLLAHPACVCSPLPPVAVNHSLHLLPTDTLHNTPFCSLLAMVKFGTRLPTLMRPQWAAHYVQYDRLNAIVSTVSDGETPEIKRQRSDEFLRLLSEDIIGANTFFLQQLEAARATIGKLKGEKTNGWTLPSGMVGDESSSMTLDEVCKLENLSEGDSAILVSMNDLVADLRALRKYVATNVVAATKIVKKHDKNYPNRTLRERVATLIVAQSFYTGTLLPEVFSEAKVLVKEMLGTDSCDASAITITVEDEEEGVQKVNAAEWLLASQRVQQAVESNKIDTASPSKNAIRQNFSDALKTRFFAIYFGRNGCGSFSGDDVGFSSSYERDDKWDKLVLADKHGAETQRAMVSALKDNWRVDFRDDSERPWGELDRSGKMKVIFVNLVKLALILGCLYLFICSLAFLADGFRLVAGKRAGEVFRNSKILGNPVSGLMVGVIATVLVQSSSTSTSITIAMVSSELLSTTQAIYIIMGANIGTSVTSTIVSLGQANNRNEFRRAFAAATIHDCFNFMTVIVLLPIEASAHYLQFISSAIIAGYGDLKQAEKSSGFTLKTMTKPFTTAVVSIDKKLITKIATEKNSTLLAAMESKPILKTFMGTKSEMSDGFVGMIVLVGSLFLLCVCLAALVKLLKSILKGRIAVWMYTSVNGDFKDVTLGRVTIPMKGLAGYISMATGFALTIMVQSSSITTSAMTPLVGLGVINLERIYPLVLGANMGTTVTGILAALASDPSKIAITLEVAYAHLLFNITGIVLFYVIWPMRALPIAAAKILGNTTAQYRWFALFYLFIMFLIVPALAILLSHISFALLLVVFILAIVVVVMIAVVNYLQSNRPDKLPTVLQNWEFLPRWMHSLEPLDSFFSRCTCCLKTEAKGEQAEAMNATKAVELAAA
jgi:solute carrier family 34 (sodium-dependent phosphate cotransporter)